VNGAEPIAYTYDTAGLLTSAGDVSLRRDAQTGAVSGASAGSVETAREYDAQGRPTRVAVTAGGVPVLEVRYGYDLRGRVASMIETRAAGSPVHTTYAYDPFGVSWRITQAESLFDYAPGESTATFTKPDFPHGPATVEGLDATARGKAEAACRAMGISGEPTLTDCTLDVGITGDTSYVASAAAVPVATATAGAELPGGGAAPFSTLLRRMSGTITKAGQGPRVRTPTTSSGRPWNAAPRWRLARWSATRPPGSVSGTGTRSTPGCERCRRPRRPWSVRAGAAVGPRRTVGKSPEPRDRLRGSRPDRPSRRGHIRSRGLFRRHRHRPVRVPGRPRWPLTRTPVPARWGDRKPAPAHTRRLREGRRTSQGPPAVP
jgi:hypothetical protein